MGHGNLKKILACCSIAGLLSSAFFAAGCSNQEDTGEKPEDQEASQQRSVSTDDDPEKLNKPDGTEVQIRGKSG